MWHFWGTKQSDSTYFQGVRTPQLPTIYAPDTIYEDCRRRVTCTHVLSFVLGHDNFKLSGGKGIKWLEGTVYLELIRHKDGSTASISRISEVIVSNCSSLMLWNLPSYTTTVLNERMCHFKGGRSKHTLIPRTYFQGGPDPPSPQDLRPWSFVMNLRCCMDLISSQTLRKLAPNAI